MVSGSTVEGDLESLSSFFEKYHSEVDGLSSSWKGSSYNNILAKAEEFVSEYKEVLSRQMNSFASACNTYEEYIKLKRQKETLDSDYATAVQNKNNTLASQYSADIQNCELQLKQLKAKIESDLVEASSMSLSSGVSAASVSIDFDTSSNNINSNEFNTPSSSTGTINNTMQAVANTAVANSGGGYDSMCEQWAEIQWESATGIPREMVSDARTAWQKFGVSTDRNNIPVGAMVYGTGSGGPYGHVGIYIGDGKVADQGGVQTMDEWLSWQNKTNCYGETGWLGWGWQNGIDLSNAKQT